MVTNLQAYAENGVILSKSSITVGDKILLTYTGLLVQSGADYIFAHIGYGDGWDDKSFILMEATEAGFTASFKVLQENSMNISFKDSADNWDNNSGANYSFPIAPKAKAAKKTDTVKKEKEEKTVKAVKTVKVEKEAKDEKKQAKPAKTKSVEEKPAKVTRKKKES